MSSINLVVVQDTPYSFLLVEGEADFIRNLKFRCNMNSLIEALDPNGLIGLSSCIFRAVEFERIHQVVMFGVDVEPTTAPLFAGRLDKAIEYGGVPKVVLAYDPDLLERSFRVFPAVIDQADLSEIKKTYPTEIPSDDGQSICLSKFPFEDPRAATAYEFEYGRWIPGNPFNALRAIIIFTDSLQALSMAMSKQN